MKINKSKHSISETKSLTLKQIPLAFVNTEYDKFKVDVNVSEELAEPKMTLVRPYDVFNSEDPYFFNSAGELINNVTLKRTGTKYYYEPQSITEYTPDTFDVSVVIKKTMQFRNDKIYPVKIGVIEEGAEIEKSKKLISIFGDAGLRGLCPPNIVINNGNMMPESLIANTIKENDILFVSSENGKTINYGKDIGTLEVNEILPKYTNIWMSVDSFGELLKKEERTDETIDGELESPQLYKTSKYKISNKYKYTFQDGIENPDYPKSEYNYSIPHPSVLLLEKPGQGYIVVTPKEMLEELKMNVSIIYEILMYVYLNSYYESERVSSWITDVPIEYASWQKSKFDMRHKKINLENLVSKADTDGEYSLRQVKLSNASVMFTGLNEDHDMIFRKYVNNTDIKKKENEITFFTTKQTVVNYTPEDIYTGNSKANIETIIADDGTVYVSISDTYDSEHRINIRDTQTFTIDDYTGKYYLCTKEGSTDIQNTVQLIKKTQYLKEAHGFIICEIEKKVEKQTKLYDIRTRGGGLPEDSIDNYEMMDIGRIDGRPYRVGSTMIIRLPKALKEHEDKIQEAVNKHIAAGDYPIFIYE